MAGLSKEQLEGLATMKNMSHIIVKQQVELLEAIIGFETKNRYHIMDEVGRLVYQAAEESGCMSRQCCTEGRGFTMHISDNNLNEVITIERPMRPCKGPFCYACCDMMAQQVHVSCYAQPIGFVREVCSPIKYHFVVYHEEGNPVYDIRAPLCRWDCCCCEDVFKVYKYGEDTVVAEIRKKFAGFAKEIFTDVDSFGVVVPKEMPVRDKALLLSAVFLIDFMFYEKSGGAKTEMS